MPSTTPNPSITPSLPTPPPEHAPRLAHTGIGTTLLWMAGALIVFGAIPLWVAHRFKTRDLRR